MEFNFRDLVQKAHFDYVGLPFPIWANAKDLLPTFPSLKGVANLLKKGQPYFMRLVLQDSDGANWIFPNEPLVSISLAKTIVETATIGEERKGTVKEYINTEDYQLTIRGVCVDLDDKDNYPTDQVNDLHEMFQINEALEVHENLFLELLGIRRLVLKDIQLDEMQGEQGMQRYTITAVSDSDFFADLKENDENRNISSLG